MKFVAEKYQETFIQFLLNRSRAAGLLSPGMGKTACVLSALNELFIDGEIRSALVVAPLRVARLTWPNEIEKWSHTRWMRVESLRGQKPSGRAQIYTTNYEQLPNLENLNFCDVVVFDEITRAKNPKSKRINALRPMLRHHRRWGLTGTPRPNSLLELFAQIRLLDDGERLGKSFSQFQQAWFQATDWNEYNWEPKEGSEQAIYQRIRDLTLTLRASDYLDLPDTIVEDVEIALPDEVKDIYRTLERELLVQFERGDVVAPNAAVLVGKLLQVTGGTVYNETRGVEVIHDAKIKALKSTLAKIGNENVIIVTNFIHERERVVDAIGGVDGSKFKGDIEAAWNSGSIRYLVVDPRSLGHGLNLQKGGRTTVWYSPNHSRELYDQLNARTARKGQEQQPMIYRLLCSGTVDEAVVETLRDRGAGQDQMLQLLTNLQRLAA